jgi:hypothetical protein
MPRRGDLTLDLSHLTFMGSEGIRLFVQLARDREGIGCLVLANPSPPVARQVEFSDERNVPAPSTSTTSTSMRTPPAGQASWVQILLPGWITLSDGRGRSVVENFIPLPFSMSGVLRPAGSERPF